MRGKDWSLKEVDQTIEAYFKLMDAQKAGQKVIKTEIYRSLSQKFPQRTPKAFEFKFQNISGVLYDNKMPYADGLKPKLAYQGLLAERVLQYVEKSHHLHGKPIDILVEKLKRAYQQGPHKAVGKGTGVVGHTLEHILKIPQNSSKEPDFMGIELKAKTYKRGINDRKKTNKLQTLFSRVPDKYISSTDKTDFLKRYGYWDEKRGRTALYTSMNCFGDSLGFKLFPTEEEVSVKFKNEPTLLYLSSTLDDALRHKHSESAFVEATEIKENGSSFFQYDKVVYCRLPQIDLFLDQLRKGNVFFDLTLSLKNEKARDHGFLWRMTSEFLPQIYSESHSYDLTSEKN